MYSVGGVIMDLIFQILLFKLRVTDTMPLRESSQWFVCTVLEGIILKMFQGET